MCTPNHRSCCMLCTKYKYTLYIPPFLFPDKWWCFRCEIDLGLAARVILFTARKSNTNITSWRMLLLWIQQRAVYVKCVYICDDLRNGNRVVICHLCMTIGGFRLGNWHHGRGTSWARRGCKKGIPSNAEFAYLRLMSASVFCIIPVRLGTITVFVSVCIC